MNRNQTMFAVALEVAPGTFFGTFGIGHLYAGKVSTGAALMISYWILQAVNFALTGFFGLGVLTGALTWLGFVVFAPTNLLGSVRH